MSVQTLKPFPDVEVAGSALSNELQALLDEVVVEQHVHQPDMFSIRLRDHNRQVLSQAGLSIGTEVTILGYAPGSQTAEKLIVGEVTAMEGEYTPHGSRTLVRGYDKSHRLHRGRLTKTYVQVTYSDVARQVASQAGLQVGTIDSTSGTHKLVSQANLSPWDFLKGIAREIGYEVSVVEGKFNFKKPAPSSGGPSGGDYNSTNPLQLVFGQDLLEFYPRLSSAQQVSTIHVRGWDPAQKQKLVGQESAGTTLNAIQATPSSLAGQFGSPEYTLVDRAFLTQAEIDSAAKAMKEQIGSSVGEGEGVSRGIPALRAGAAVSISEVPGDFAGKYTLTETRHVFDAEGYRTHFVIGGRQDRSLLGLMSLGRANGSVSAGGPPIYGMVIGIVTDNNDPDKLARVKLKFPWLSDDYATEWTRVVQLGAGPDSGAVFLPENNDEVLVAFEFGDIRRPYVIGGLYNGQDKPKLGQGLFDNGKVKRRGFISRKGHQFILFDDASKSGVALITSDNQIKIAMDETNKEIHIACGSGKMVIESQGDISLESKTGKITLKAQQDVEVSGMNVKAEAQTQLSMKGATTELNGSGQTTIKGGMVAIN